MQFFWIENIAFEFLNYPVSYVELIGTLFGLVSVFFASRANILTWGTGILNELFLFILFFQVQLYADMFLQVYFFAVTIYGWHYWKTQPGEHSITSTENKTRIILACILLIGTLLAGLLFTNIHLYWPQYFRVKASYPFADSFVMVLSIIATVLLAKKRIETWYLWIVVDLVCVLLFLKKGVIILSLEYLVFLGLATYGLLNWKKKLSNG